MKKIIFNIIGIIIGISVVIWAGLSAGELKYRMEAGREINNN